ncbi:7-carboxy-7-deazaguanine synthase QueE [Candidatus Uabimicrobium sp. HlEnr_7]|uniref:7-carboxy-7-deazaguanine synthase QueE n=1 Tax=Candidatus Uabimicrobium helgolandensis TaxID=3095367 RepID=UPI003558DC22
MLISEIFYSLQGEGLYTGYPSVFIRTSGCNLRCSWCDTPYTSWYPEGKNKSMNEIMIETKAWERVSHYVITGGEPMVQSEMGLLITKLKERSHFITIETAGTVFSESIKPDYFSISPKLKNSYPSKKDSKELKIHSKNNLYHALKDFIQCGTKYQFKFVVKNRKDTDEILELVNKYDIPRHTVFLMPEGRSVEELAAKSHVIAEICKEEQFNFCNRLQIYLWGDTKGT